MESPRHRTARQTERRKARRGERGERGPVSSLGGRARPPGGTGSECRGSAHVPAENARPVGGCDDLLEQLDWAVHRAVGQACRYTELARQARSEVAELLAMGTAVERLRAVAGDRRRFSNPALVPALVEHSRSAVSDHPVTARELAGLALAIARRLPAEPFGERFRRDREAEAGTVLADALLACGELDRATASLKASERCAAGSADMLLLADQAEVAASLASARERWRESMEHLERAELLLLQGGADEELLSGLERRREEIGRTRRAESLVS